MALQRIRRRYFRSGDRSAQSPRAGTFACGPTFSEQRACIMPTSAKAQKRSCPHCGALYEVHRSVQNGPRQYRTAVCTHCGDVMAEWEGRIRHYRRIRRPKRSTQAARLLNQAAAAAELKRRKRTRGDSKPSRSGDTYLTRRSEMNDTRRKGTKERSASARGKIAKPQRPQDEKKKPKASASRIKL